jgi:maltose phosphorylase
MNIVYGFGGMRSDGDMLSFNPTIPAQWQGYSFEVTYRGSVLRVEVSHEQAIIRVKEGAPVTIRIAGQVHEVDQIGGSHGLEN